MASANTNAPVFTIVSQTMGSKSSKTSSPSGYQKQEIAFVNKTIPLETELQLLCEYNSGQSVDGPSEEYTPNKYCASICTSHSSAVIQLYRLFRVKDGQLQAKVYDSNEDCTGVWRPFDETQDSQWLQQWAVGELGRRKKVARAVKKRRSMYRTSKDFPL
jgi:hypothetical protein